MRMHSCEAIRGCCLALVSSDMLSPTELKEGWTMQSTPFWRRMLKRILRRHGDVKRFDHAVHEHGTVTGIADIGTRTVPAAKIVGSVSRWRNLRSDFFYRQGAAMTERFRRI